MKEDRWTVVTFRANSPPSTLAYAMKATEEFEIPKQISHLMEHFDGLWFICGGWAIDLFLNRQSRPHKDIEIGVLRKDQLALKTYLAGWSFEKAPGDGSLINWEEGEYLEHPWHCIWARKGGDFIEILLNDASETHFLFRRDRSISLELGGMTLTNEAGIPFLAPEIVLLYKAKYSEMESDEKDFTITSPYLSFERKKWLKAAIERLYPDHRGKYRL